MAINIRFVSGEQAGRELEIEDVDKIVMGRDPARCHVVFPASETRVGREHCALRRELGRYRVVLNRDNLVRINGRPAIDDEELPERCEVQLGEGGPTLAIQTVQRGDLPDTQPHRVGPGRATMIFSVQRSARRTRQIAALSAVLLIVACVVGFIVLRGTEESVKEEIAAGQKETEEKIAEDIEAQLAELTEEQKQLLADMTDKFENVEERVQSLEPRFADVMKKAAESVYLVLIQTEPDKFSLQATAWVVDQEQGILATNAHVARLFDGLTPGQVLVARSPGADPVDFVVQTVQVHPGFDQFDQLWMSFGPAHRTALGELEHVQAPGAGCDVALMHVADATGLDEALPLADDATLAAIDVGYPVCMVGYPMEGLVLGGVNPEQPMPLSHVAYVIALTTYFGVGQGDFAHRLLVQHAIPSAGGASGSPILNSSGEVVAVHNAGNIVGVAEGGRIGSGALINFGQRVDLVRELLNGTADTVQPERTRVWTEDLGRFYISGTEEERKTYREYALANAISSWQGTLMPGGDVDVVVDDVANLTGQLSTATAYTDTFESVLHVDLPDTRPCLVTAVHDGDGPLALEVVEVEGVEDRFTYPDTGPETWLRAVSLQPQWQSLRLRLSGGPEGSNVAVTVRQATATAVSIEARRARLVETWELYLRDVYFVDMRGEVLQEGSGQLFDDGNGRGSAYENVALPDAGYYLAIAQPGAGEDLDLMVTRNDFAGQVTLFEDRSYASYASGYFEVYMAEAVDLYFIGPMPGVNYQWVVYRAVPR